MNQTILSESGKATLEREYAVMVPHVRLTHEMLILWSSEVMRIGLFQENRKQPLNLRVFVT